MANPKGPSNKDSAAEILDLLTCRLTPGKEEKVHLSDEALQEVEGRLRTTRDSPELAEALRGIYRIAFLLDTELDCPLASKALFSLARKFGRIEEVFSSEKDLSTRPASWQTFLGAHRSLARAKRGGRALGKKSWEIDRK